MSEAASDVNFSLESGTDQSLGAMSWIGSDHLMLANL